MYCFTCLGCKTKDFGIAPLGVHHIVWCFQTRMVKECSLHLNFSFAAQLQIYTFILYRRNVQEKIGTSFQRRDVILWRLPHVENKLCAHFSEPSEAPPFS